MHYQGGYIDTTYTTAYTSTTLLELKDSFLSTIFFDDGRLL